MGSPSKRNFAKDSLLTLQTIFAEEPPVKESKQVVRSALILLLLGSTESDIRQMEPVTQLAIRIFQEGGGTYGARELAVSKVRVFLQKNGTLEPTEEGEDDEYDPSLDVVTLAQPELVSAD